MATFTRENSIPSIVGQKLAQVRRSIRAYVWLECLAVMAIVAAAAFWVGLLLDWTLEPSPAVRLAVWVAVALLGAWVLYRFLLRRAFVPLPDASLAALLERRFAQLRDHLLTTVDLAAGHDAQYHPALIDRTQRAAAEALAEVDPRDVLRRAPLMWQIALAIALSLTIAVFAFAARDAFSFWVDRLALSPEPWPRRVHLEVPGFPVDETGRRTQKIARDDAFELIVRASTKEFVAPDEVEFRFQSADGGRGRDTMIRVGEAVPGRDDHQTFRYDFKDVSSSLVLDVVGGDDRVQDLHLQIVNRPELVEMEIECVYPEYLNRPARRLPITGGMRIPEGTKLTLHATSTKPLTEIQLSSTEKPHPTVQKSVATPLESFRWEYGPLSADDVLAVHVVDHDGVACREPYRISLSIVPDEPPQVAVRLAGIGSAITPDALVPLAGKVTDDYALDSIWCEYGVGDGPTHDRAIAQLPDRRREVTTLGTFDARAERGAVDSTLQLEPGQTLRLTFKASDHFDLEQQPHIGTSQQFALDVVTPAQLLALLERRELELRQRFEAVFAKMTDTRNLLSRVDFDEPTATVVGQPENTSPDSSAERGISRRRLRVAGALQNVTQSRHELLGLAESFDDILAQLQNNRIDNADLKNRIQNHIAQPLRHVSTKSMSKLDSQLQLVNEHIAEPERGAPALAAGIQLADAVLVELQQILDRMLELESYNEVVGLLRGIIDDQKNLNQRTKEKQSTRLQELLDE